MSEYPTGEELNALVAAAKEWPLQRYHDGDVWARPGECALRLSEWNPSEDIADAWPLLSELINEKGGRWRVQRLLADLFGCELIHGALRLLKQADQAPRWISLAYCKAKGVL